MFSTIACRNDEPVKMDLHVHTTASDGRLSPNQVVMLAAERGVRYLAITDHDTTAGLQEAMQMGDKAGVIVLPGIELSTLYREQEVHILGYFIDEKNPELQTKLLELKESRCKRTEKMVEKLKNLGYPVTMEEVRNKSRGGVLGRPHLALVLQDHGIVSSVEEAFAKLLNPGRPGYVPRLRISPREAVSLISQAGGAAVLAHPGDDLPVEILPACLEAGLAGIEVYHPLHSPALQDYYQDMANKMQLVATGGSDFHGHDEGDWERFGAYTLPAATVLRLKNAAIYD